MTKVKATSPMNRRKSTRLRNDIKYASKYLSDAIDPLIEKQLESVKKNPKAIQKWTQKMKSSLLRKVHLASKTLFCKKAISKDHLQSELTRLQVQIEEKSMNINEINKRILQYFSSESCFADLTSYDAEMNQKDFDLSKIENLASDLNSRGTKIIDNFSSLKQNLELLSTNLQSRLDSLQSTASSIASELEQFDKTQNSATTSFTPNQSNSAVKGMESSSTILHPNAMSSNLSGEAILDGDLTEDDQYQQMLNHLSSAD